ncbi:AAA family ATPase [Aggregatibacter actinomycetemcomitans]|nr:AAA family ATPase [Aggregatibacter actinomycetemcomitans]
MHIKIIKIKNFRSIKKQEISLENINVFYGLNDVGKSNVLKALNLFFNDKISHYEEFDFSKDFCKFATVSTKKAKEICIELTLSPPDSYQDNKEFTWTKIWRKDGLYKDYFNKSSESVLSPKRIPKKYSWAKKLKYRYVPAMKDNLYFSNLLRELYGILSESISENLSDASNKFLNVIKKSTKDMSDDLSENLKIKSEISFPDDLGSLFSTLDFQTGDKDNLISIKNRGDGIKIRHIPSILQFFHRENNRLNNKGSIRTDTIWGYEEPENNLEGLAAFDKSRQFLSISSQIQILLTTHSPAFYLMKKESTNCNLFQTIQENDEVGTEYIIKDNISYDIQNNDKGFLALITPFLEEEVDRNSRLKAKLDEITSKVKNYLLNKNIIFVEGKSDEVILKRYIELCNKENEYEIIGCGGANQVSEYLLSWCFNPDVNDSYEYTALGIVDCDKAGIEAKKYFDDLKKFAKEKHKSRVIKNINKVNVKTLPIPEYLKSIKEIFKENLAITIESHFLDKISDSENIKNGLES